MTEMTSIDADEWIYGHAVTARRQWWADHLNDAGLNDTVISAEIRRGDIFELAAAAATDPEAALTLLWNALAWGSGNKIRNNTKRIASVAESPSAAGQLLMRAAECSKTSPEAAYEILYPNGRTAIGQLGPAFFTKYLYFAGGGKPDHPCLIIDENVARALHDSCGWESLPVKEGHWYASTYNRYCALVANWVNENEGITRRDIVERWLFEEGKRLAAGR